MDFIIPIAFTILGVAVLIAALKAALGPDDMQHRKSDGGTGVGIGYGHTSKNSDDNDSDGDGGGGD
ncbi:MAG: hypothetical protein ACRCT6_00360 [Notoacmeibacter sp.]